jgi:hypothetical protein
MAGECARIALVTQAHAKMDMSGLKMLMGVIVQRGGVALEWAIVTAFFSLRSFWR